MGGNAAVGGRRDNVVAVRRRQNEADEATTLNPMLANAHYYLGRADLTAYT